jgi:hypothetical protein
MTSMLGRCRHLGITVAGLRSNAANVGRKPKIRQFERPLARPGHSKSKMYARHTDRFEGGIIHTLEREGSAGRFAFRLAGTGMRS